MNTKIEVVRTREDKSREVIWEIGLEELCELQKAFPRKMPIEADGYALAINVAKFE